jgi:phage-related holin
VDWIKATLFTVGGCVGAVLGPIATPLIILVVLMATDLMSALVANGKRSKIDPGYGWGGWKRKTNTLILVLSLAVLQQLGADQGITGLPAAQVVAGGFALIEFFSVVRNAILSGVILPGFLADVIVSKEAALMAKPPGGPLGGAGATP